MDAIKKCFEKQSEDQYMCKCVVKKHDREEQCNDIIKSNKDSLWNLKRHVVRKHEDVMKNIEQIQDLFLSLCCEHELNRISSIAVYGSYVVHGRCMICDIFCFLNASHFDSQPSRSHL